MESDSEYRENLADPLAPLNPRDLTVIQQDILKETYQQLTSQMYLNQTEEQIMDELNDLRKFLDYEAQRYRLHGAMRLVHTSMLVEDFDDVSIDDMLSYIDLMHYDIDERLLEFGTHLEIATYLHIQLRRRLENLREYNYVSQLFFDDAVIKRPILFDNPPSFQTRGHPDPFQILRRGVDYYFFRIGELTGPALEDRYDFRELFQMLMIIGRLQWNAGDKRVQDDSEHDLVWQINNLTRKRDLIQALLMTIQDLRLDPRMYMLMDGPQSAILSENGELTLSIADDTRLTTEAIQEGLTLEGIQTTYPNDDLKPFPLMFTEYTIAQLTVNFSGHYGSHRLFEEAVYNDKFTDAVLVEDVSIDEMIFYGLRDGFSRMFAFRLEELYNSFAAVGDFYDPWTIIKFPENPYLWTKFPRRIILRLVNVVLPLKVPKTRWAKKLIKVCQDILNKDPRDTEELEIRAMRLNIERLSSVDLETEMRLKKALHRMYNVGIQFLEWDQQLAYHDQDAIVALTMKDPLFVAPDVNTTGRIRAETRKLIMFLQDSMEQLGEWKEFFIRLRIVRTGPPKIVAPEDLPETTVRERETDNIREINADNRPKIQDYYLTYDDDSYTIGPFVEMMYTMSRYNLSNVLQVCGLWLMITANMYAKLITGTSLNAFRFEFEED